MLRKGPPFHTLPIQAHGINCETWLRVNFINIDSEKVHAKDTYSSHQKLKYLNEVVLEYLGCAL